MDKFVHLLSRPLLVERTCAIHTTVSEVNTSSSEAHHPKTASLRKGQAYLDLTMTLCCNVATALVTGVSLVSARFPNAMGFAHSQRGNTSELKRFLLLCCENVLTKNLHFS